MTPAAPDERTRDDRCPGVLALHEAADGWLARIRVPGGRLSPAALRALATVSERFGNGLVDLTARANIQVRGLERDVGTQLLATLQTAGLLPSAAHDRVRNVLASPLAGRGPGALDDVDDVVQRLDAQITTNATLSELPGRFCFLVDDGSGNGREIGPDVTIVAHGETRFGVALDGRPLQFEGDAVESVAIAVGAAEAFVAARGDAWRLSETPGGAGTIAAALGIALAPIVRAARTRGLAPGALRQRDGRTALTALAPLGQLWPALLRELARIGSDVRLSTRRTVTLVDLDAELVDPTSTVLTDAGLVLDGASGWVGLTACAGTGACPRALGDVRDAAAARALQRAPDDPPEHWAACDRRCGELAGTPVSVAMHAPDDVELRFDAHSWRLASLDGAAARLLLEAAR